MQDQSPEISNDEIAAMAHRIWEEEGQPEGKAEEHWQRAEEIVRNRGGKTEANAS